MKSSFRSKFNSERLKLTIDYYRYLLPFSLKNRFRNNLNNDSIISIFSAPRGGSTWLAEILSQIPDSSLVWEPLFRHPEVSLSRINPFSYPNPKKIGIWWNQYVPENESWPELEDFFERLFNRELVNLKLYRHTYLENVSRSKFFIFKFCFGNLMLPWLTKRFAIKPILLVRHPCAVVASQLKFGGFRYMKKNPKVNVPTWTKYHEYYFPYEEIMRTVDTPEESLAIRWALTHVYPLNHPKNNVDWLTVSYESLLMNTQSELERIKNWTGIDFHFDEKRIKKASFTSHKEKIDPPSQILNWKKNMSLQQISSVLDIVKSVGINIYNDEAMPDLSLIYGQGK